MSLPIGIRRHAGTVRRKRLAVGAARRKQLAVGVGVVQKNTQRLFGNLVLKIKGLFVFENAVFSKIRDILQIPKIWKCRIPDF
jgi:hypothetical protein